VGGATWIPVGDKVAHGVAYGVLGSALAWGRIDSEASLAHGWLLALGMVYGMSDEWHQMYVPGRSPDPADLLADAVGLSLGYGTTWTLLGRTTNEHAGTLEDETADNGEPS